VLSLIEIMFSSIGVYGFFVQNWICATIGLIGIVICDFIDIFISGHDPTITFLAIMFGIGVSIANKNPLYGFTIALCGENLIMSIIIMVIMVMSFIKYCIKKDKSTEIREDLMKYLDYNKFTEIEKYVELSKIVMNKLNTESIDEAIEMTYSFYKEQGVDVDKIEEDKNNKFATLSKLVMLGLDTDSIDEAIEETNDFYASQEIQKENNY